MCVFVCLSVFMCMQCEDVHAREESQHMCAWMYTHMRILCVCVCYVSVCVWLYVFLCLFVCVRGLCECACTCVSVCERVHVSLAT